MIKDLEFDWPSMRIAIEGQSFIDVPKLQISNRLEAKKFLFSYGYNPDDPVVREELWRIYFEALAFLRTSLLNPNEKIPVDFLKRGPSNEIEKLLLEASKQSPDSRSRWSCAILRVMHIISHLDNDIRLENFQYAREQIFERFDPHVRQIEKRKWIFGTGPHAVPLVRYIKKHRKERNSIIIKLLSKPTTVVEEIYDSIGFKFVVQNRFDIYRLMRSLFASGAVSVPNIQPGRSVNSLLSYPSLFELIENTRKELSKGQISIGMARKRIEKLEDEALVSWNELKNPLTSRWYRAIQFTCRQLITAPDPTFRFWNEVKSQLNVNKTTETLLKKIPITLRERKTFYYPFEIQILDKASYVEAIGGRSRHREYKMRQRLMARNRVLRDLI